MEWLKMVSISCFWSAQAIKVYKDELTHEKAERTLEKIAGDKNGEGGYDHVADAVIVNLKALF
jgi:hypothetical protein